MELSRRDNPDSTKIKFMKIERKIQGLALGETSGRQDLVFFWRGSVLAITLVAMFALPVTAGAAVTYARSPLGAEVPSSLTITVSADSFAEFGMPPETLSYNIQIEEFEGALNFQGSCYLTSETATNSHFDLPPSLQVMQIYLIPFNTTNCTLGTEIAEYNLEGDGTGVIFTVLPAAQAVPPAGGGTLAYRPEVTVLAPKGQQYFSSEVPILYQATDKNDTMSELGEHPFGLSSTPVSIYYSDTIMEWENTIIASDDKKFITKGEPALGSYTWQIKNVRPGNLYRIVVEAIDKTGEIGNAVSDFFSIDLSPPTFIVRADPPVVQKGKVLLTIESGEELKEVPNVIVTQRGGESITVPITMRDNNYEGAYEVRVGFDGTARIAVSGIDRAGNKGTTILSGGSFNVGVRPPPPPVVISPLQNATLKTDQISVSGTTRPDTEILLTVNGDLSYTALPEVDGAFVIKNIPLEKSLPHGENVISVVARDQAGTTGEAAVLRLSLNAGPTVTLLQPLEGSILSGTAALLSALVLDLNNDPVLLRFEARSLSSGGVEWGSDLGWQSLGETLSGKLLLNTTELFDGPYLVRAVGGDGIVTTTSLERKVVIENQLPLIRFIDGKRTVVSGHSATVYGSVFASDITGSRPTVTQVAYSRDQGVSWVALPAADGTYNSFEERFAITFVFGAPLEGTHEILWRATDSRGFIVTARHPVVVDTAPPQAPTIAFPGAHSVVSRALDEDTKKAGLQITLRGKAEPRSIVEIKLLGRSYRALSSFDDGGFRQAIEIPTTGKYIIEAVAEDAAGNRSAKTTTNFTYNSPPTIVFTSPRDGRGVHGIYDVRWILKDPDGDIVKYLSLRHSRGKQGGVERSAVTLAKDPKAGFFTWDTTKIETGNDHLLTLEANDGFATSSETIAISVDNTPPTLLALSIQKRAFTEAGTLSASGDATDDLSGVEYVEYVVVRENEKTSTKGWLKGTITKGALSKKVSWNITAPLQVDDGSYRMLVRAVDASGNVSLPKEEAVVVDSTPPRLGSLSLLYNNAPIYPKEKSFKIPVNVSIAITLSLEDDTKEASVTWGAEKKKLDYDIATGIWKTTLSFAAAETAMLSLATVDKSGNKGLLENIATVSVVHPGKVTYQENGQTLPVREKTIVVQVLDPNRNAYSDWKAESSTYGGLSDLPGGAYLLALPRGTYRLTAASDESFDQSSTEPFTITEAQFITEDIMLHKKKLSFWGIIKAWLGKKFSR
ncbi:MAG: hypothetical protein Q7S52_04620 [bacterium]|nr:hypothetical protein [bacterium]